MKKSNDIYGILAPITTPFVDEKVDLGRLQYNVEKYGQSKLRGFFVLGSNGEGKNLIDDEKLEILRIVISTRKRHQIVIAGTGYESTFQTIEFSQRVADLGTDFVSILTPSYYRKQLKDDAYIRYYMEIADAIPIPIFVYNVPGHTGVSLSHKVIKVISQHPNIVGIKDTSPDMIAHYLEVSGDDFLVFSGTVNTLFSAILLGAPGGVASLADAFPNACHTLYELASGGHIDEARALHLKLLRLNRMVSGSYGVAGVKYAMELTGYQGGDPRRPMLPLTDEDKKIILAAVEQAEIMEIEEM